jgi:tetratricopeptide (TPR) repeat protein
MDATSTVTPERLDAVRSLYERGLYLQAYRAAESLGPLRAWQGPEARVLAARLANQLGAPRLALWHNLKAWREDPHHPEVRYYRGWTILQYSGPYDTWLFLQQQGDLPEAPAAIRVAWYALHAHTAGLLRDFERAEQWMRRARDVDPDDAWLHVTRAAVLELEDRYAEALEAADAALAVRPWFRPAVQTRAHLLTLLLRDDEAFEFLHQAAEHIESAALHWQLGGIYFEREEYAQVEESLRRFEEMSPLLERWFGRSFFALRALLAYRQGNDAAAIEWLHRSSDEDAQHMAQRLADPQRRDRPRRTLPVGFTRQHHVTCGPATLATISHYWSMPAEHLQVAEQICYDGTSALAERRWAEQHAWAVREFTVTEQAAQRLIDAGIPFTLTTTEATSAHLQAVVGYDGRLGTLIIRDPYLRNRREVTADKFLARYRAFGPRGMALVPASQSARLEALDLPDVSQWDALHRLDAALDAHRREEAAEIYARLEQEAPQHFLTLHARWRLAMYDANELEQLAAVERLRELFPHDARLQLMRLSLLRSLGRREERLHMLAELAQDRDADSVFPLQYAQELGEEARHHTRAVEMLRGVIRKRPADARAFAALGNVEWSRLHFDTALELYRFAVCLEDKDESLAESYFRAAQHCRQTATALDWLRQRFERFGHKSSQPAHTLVWALNVLDRTSDALAVVEEALRRRPDDGELRLFAAYRYATASAEHAARAAELLQQAADRSPRALWLNVAAQIAWCRGDLHEALQWYQQSLQLQPLNVGTHRWVAQLLSDTQGRQAALEHLRAAAERFPHYEPLLQLWIEWLRDEPPGIVEPVIRRLIELNPANAWAVRELGFVLLHQGRLDEAQRLADEAAQLDPAHVACYHLRGDLCQARGHLPQACDEYRTAIRLSVDDDYAINQLLACCDTLAQRREALQFVELELVQQVVYGQGLLAYRHHAHTVLDPEELLASLQQALAERPDLWHAWSACVEQLMSMERLHEARRLAEEATRRFPLLPRVWLDLAEVCGAQRDLEAQLAALHSAYRINPTWSEAARALATVHRQRGDHDQAHFLLELAIQRDPSSAVNYGFLAEVQWETGHREEALQHLERAVQLEPSYHWAWDQLRAWAAEAGQPDRPQQAARQLVARKPGAVGSWLTLARVLPDESLDERLQALDRAIALDPRCVEAYDERARLLGLAGRHDEARHACAPRDVWPEQLPAKLQARAAWVEWMRGHRDAALRVLREALEADPGLFGAWWMLADWAEELHRSDVYLEAAQRMVQLEPYNEIALSYHGQALALHDRHDEARSFFQRAFDIQPRYAFAGICLFDVQMQQGDLQAAGQTLQQLQAMDNDAFILARAVQWNARRGQLADALHCLQQLCHLPADNDWPMQTALDALRQADAINQAVAVLESAVQQGNTVQPEVSRHWAHWRTRLGSPPDADLLMQLAARGPTGERAVLGYFECLLEQQRVHLALRFAQRHRHWLRNRTFTWGAVAWLYSATRQWRPAYRWCRNWRDYPDALPWMLVNAAEAFRAARHDAEGAEVSRHALSLPEDHGCRLHRLWLASDLIRQGRYEQAAELIAQVAPETLDEDYAFLHMLLSADLEMATAPPEQREALFVQLQEQIDQQVRGYSNLKFEPARYRFLCFSRRLLARCIGTWRACWWAYRPRLLV